MASRRTTFSVTSDAAPWPLDGKLTATEGKKSDKQKNNPPKVPLRRTYSRAVVKTYEGAVVSLKRLPGSARAGVRVLFTAASKTAGALTSCLVPDVRGNWMVNNSPICMEDSDELSVESDANAYVDLQLPQHDSAAEKHQPEDQPHAMAQTPAPLLALDETAKDGPEVLFPSSRLTMRLKTMMKLPILPKLLRSGGVPVGK